MTDSIISSETINQIKPINKNLKNKKKIFKREREIILEKMYNILGISETNKIFYCYEIEKEKKDIKIIELYEEIKQYFCTGTWRSLKGNDPDEKNSRYKSIIRSVLRDMEITYTRSGCKIRVDNEMINTSRYHIS